MRSEPKPFDSLVPGRPEIGRRLLLVVLMAMQAVEVRDALASMDAQRIARAKRRNRHYCHLARHYIQGDDPVVN